MEKKKVERMAKLFGDIEIYLKEPESYLDKNCEVQPVRSYQLHHVAIVEMEGKCYAAIPLGERTLTGILRETRDSFDDLVAQYNAGSNASENGGVSPAD